MTDPQGLGLKASVSVVSDLNHVNDARQTDASGQLRLRHLNYGLYTLKVGAAGFASLSRQIEINSEQPIEQFITLKVAALESRVEVNDIPTLLDPRATGPVYRIGAGVLKNRPASSPGRGVLELVNTQPGWLLEANGVLHPRGSEYDTQYVIDGVPISDNRSPAFAPEFEPDEIQSMTVLTGNYPAEYGRKLGGVIEVSTAGTLHSGFHGKVIAEGGSFATSQGLFAGQYLRGRTGIEIDVHGFRTDRYLDPPTEQNHSNTGSGKGFNAIVDRDFASADNVRASVWYSASKFLVPNEEIQEQAGQRQNRDAQETGGRLSLRHIFTPNLLGNIRLMVRDLEATLASNAQSLPIKAAQDRDFRETYLAASLAGHVNSHEWKVGNQVIFTSVRERFAYEITDPGFFDEGVPATFNFSGERLAGEGALYAQDVIRLGNLNLSGGLRWDRYSFLVNDKAFSPRLGVGRNWPSAGLLLHASFDRTFTIPAFENLLFSSSLAAQQLTGSSTGLPVRLSRGNFFQAGLSKTLLEHVRVDATYFRRHISNFADDDLLLNTGVSFPIALSRGRIHGFESKIEVPRWGSLSGFISYSNQVGTGFLPVTGGLLLEPDAQALLASTDRLPISQDQRNTVRAFARYQLTPAAWVGLGGWYGSGLPVELDKNVDLGELQARFSPRILKRIDFQRGRVRPSSSFDFAFGARLWSYHDYSLRLQTSVSNLFNRLNVINFAGLFSGTAIASPRQFDVRLEADF